MAAPVELSTGSAGGPAGRPAGGWQPLRVLGAASDLSLALPAAEPTPVAAPVEPAAAPVAEAVAPGTFQCGDERITASFDNVAGNVSLSIGGEALTLPQAQARDWLAFLHSTVWMLPLSAEQIDPWLSATLRAERPEVRAEFLHACRQLGRLRHLPRSRRFGRDTVALQAVAAAAHRHAQQASHTD